MNFIEKLFEMLFGSDWKTEPGSMIMCDKNGNPEVFDYTHWREQSFFRGKSYQYRGWDK